MVIFSAKSVFKALAVSSGGVATVCLSCIPTSFRTFAIYGFIGLSVLAIVFWLLSANFDTKEHLIITQKQLDESQKELKKAQSNKTGLEEERTYLLNRIHDLEIMAENQSIIISFAKEVLSNIASDEQLEQEEQNVLKKIQSHKNN